MSLHKVVSLSRTQKTQHSPLPPTPHNTPTRSQTQTPTPIQRHTRKTHTHTHTNAHAHAHTHAHVLVYVNEVLETATCSKKKHCGRSQASNSRYKKRVFTAQHSTAQRITARRSVLLSIRLCLSPCIKKKAKINSARKIISAHVWHFPGIQGSFAGCRSFLYRNLRSKSKTPVCNHFGRHGMFGMSVLAVLVDVW